MNGFSMNVGVRKAPFHSPRKMAFLWILSAALLFPSIAAAEGESGQKYMIGVKGTYQESYIGKSFTPRTQTMRDADGVNRFYSSGGSVLFMTTPSPILSHLAWSTYIDFVTYSQSTDEKTLRVSRTDLGAGLYLTSGNVREGNVGLYLGVIAAASGLSLQGNFNFTSSSYYQLYIAELAAARAQQRTSWADSLNRIDVLTYSRSASKTLTKDRRNVYYAYKAGLINLDQFIIADIALGKNKDLTTIALLGLAGTTLDERHRYYALNQDSAERKGDFAGVPVILELGYIGDNILIQYTAEAPSQFRGKGDNFYMEQHTLKVGVYVKL